MAPTFDAAALVGLRRVGAIAASPDGTWLAAAVQRLDDDAYASDLWRVATGGSGARPLTHGPSKDRAPRFRADGGLIFLSDRAVPGEPDEPGARRTQVWLLPAGGGEPERLTDEPLGVADVRPLPGDGLALLVERWPGVADGEQRAHDADRRKHGPTALRYRDPPVRHWDAWMPPTALHLVVVVGGARRDLTPDAGHELRNRPGEAILEVSPAGDRIAVAWGRPGADRAPDTWVRVVDVATGAATDLGAAAATSFGDVRFSPDGRRVAAVRSRRARGTADVARLVVFDVAGGDGRVVSDWDAAPTLGAWTRDGAALLATADHEGDCPVWRVDVATGEVARVTAAAAGGSHGELCTLPDGRIAGVRHAMLQPPEPFVCDATPGATPRLAAAISGLSADEARAIATWESRRVAGDGGTPVQYFLARPAGGGPHPLLFSIHGGPIHQHADGWHWRWNVLAMVAAGYAVALPNPRGSTGRGQRFADEVQGNAWGGACYRDLMAVADDVARQPGVDAARMVAMGGSFGGYMVNWIGTQTDRFRAIVSHAGIFSFPAFHGACDYPAWFTLEMGQSPYDGDLAAYVRYSPHAHVAGWRTPALILHGEKDYRVPVSEALLLFDALRARGVEAELVVFPDENHWIVRPRNVVAWYDAWQGFVARHVA